jgi:hypothetical protein
MARGRTGSSALNFFGRHGAWTALVALGVLCLLGAQASAEPQPSSFVQSCVRQELVRPDVEYARLSAPGKAGQTASIKINYGATPDECRGVVQRNFQYEIVLKQVLRRHGELLHITTRFEHWYATRFTQEEAGFREASYTPSGHNPLMYYHCSVGKAKTKLLLKSRGTIKNLADQQVAGRKFFSVPFEVIGRGKHGC